MSLCIRLACVVALLALLEACIVIPIEGDVDVMAWTKIGASPDPMDAQDTLVLLGPARADDDGFPSCVRKALTAISSQTHMVSSAAFRAAADGKLASDLQLDNVAIGEVLHDAATRQAAANLRVRYLAFVEGKTRTYNIRGGGGGGSASQTTDIAAHIWDAPNARPLADIATAATGDPWAVSGAGGFPPVFIYIGTYVRTESKACSKMAQEIQHLLLTKKKGV